MNQRTNKLISGKYTQSLTNILLLLLFFFMCVSQVMALKRESDENDGEKKAESEESRQRRIEELQVRMCVCTLLSAAGLSNFCLEKNTSNLLV